MPPGPDDRVPYHLKQPGADSNSAVALRPEELLEMLANLVPRLRVYQTRYHHVAALYHVFCLLYCLPMQAALGR